jgi:hypothetical protein
VAAGPLFVDPGAVLLTIATTHRPATDLGYLLHKHPDRQHVAELSFGTARLFYPQASAERCCAAILLDVDPVGLVRDTAGPASQFALGGYVNDRPYAASSFLSAALAKLLGTAMAGRSKERPELAGQPIALEIGLAVLPCRGGGRCCAGSSSRSATRSRPGPSPWTASFPTGATASTWP